MLCCDNNFAVSFQIECDPKMDQNHGGGGDGSAASSNQSKRSLVNKTPEPCLVCGVPTSTLHLQVCWNFKKQNIFTETQNDENPPIRRDS